MSTDKNSIHTGNISGSFIIGNGNQAVGHNGQIVNTSTISTQNLEGLVSSITTAAIHEGIKSESESFARGLILELETRVKEKPQNTELMHQILRTLRSVTEGTIGSLIAAYLGKIGG